MATEIKVKKIGMSVAPITLVEWKAKEGEWVREGDIVLVVETEKIRSDIEAAGSGFLHIVLKEMSNAAAGSVAGILAGDKDELTALQSKLPSAVANAEAGKAEEIPQSEAPTPIRGKSERDRISISPLARKLAEEHRVDISALQGSGPDGRIVKEDVEHYLRTRGAEAFEYDGREVEETIPLTGTRQVIAEHMHRSLSIAAQLTVMGEIDMSGVVKVREILANQEKTLGTKVTYTDLVLFAVARVLRDYPMINASIVDNEIKVWKSVNIAVAVDLGSGLITPVVRHADRKSLVEISKEVKTLVNKARERTLIGEEIKGGTFTLSNVGAVGAGWRFDTVIINQPQSAILSTGGITDRVVAREGQIMIRPVMPYSLTYDHRLIDGGLATQFINDITGLLEDPGWIGVEQG